MPASTEPVPWLSRQHIDIRLNGTNVSSVPRPTTDPGDVARLGQVRLSAATPQAEMDNGIEVHEEEWGRVAVQLCYQMRCDCGRSWFELELPKVVRCPACRKLSLVSV